MNDNLVHCQLISPKVDFILVLLIGTLCSIGRTYIMASNLKYITLFPFVFALLY